jgi:hypothetical protein
MISKKPMTQTIPSTIYFDRRGDFEASSDNFASLLSSSKIASNSGHSISHHANNAHHHHHANKQPSSNRINYKQLDSKSINYFGYNLNPSGGGSGGNSGNGNSIQHHHYHQHNGGIKTSKKLPPTKSTGNMATLLTNNSTSSFTSLIAGVPPVSRNNATTTATTPANKMKSLNHFTSQSQFFKPVEATSTTGFDQESFIIGKHQHQLPARTFQKYAIERQINHFMNNKEHALNAAATHSINSLSGNGNSGGSYRPKSSSKSNSKFMISKMLSGDLENDTTKSMANLMNSASHANFNSTSTISIDSGEVVAQEKNSKSGKNVSLQIFYFFCKHLLILEIIGKAHSEI